MPNRATKPYRSAAHLARTKAFRAAVHDMLERDDTYQHLRKLRQYGASKPTTAAAFGIVELAWRFEKTAKEWDMACNAAAAEAEADACRSVIDAVYAATERSRYVFDARHTEFNIGICVDSGYYTPRVQMYELYDHDPHYRYTHRTAGQALPATIRTGCVYEIRVRRTWKRDVYDRGWAVVDGSLAVDLQTTKKTNVRVLVVARQDRRDPCRMRYETRPVVLDGGRWRLADYSAASASQS